MRISAESELMPNHRQAMVLAPDRSFQAVPTVDGDALFFSIGTDNVLYLTREVIGTATGWDRLDLSSGLSANHGGAPIRVRTFAVAQNPRTRAVDLALVVTVDGADQLYLSLDNANTADAWAQAVTWKPAHCDAPTVAQPLTIAGVTLQSLPARTGGGTDQNIIVDVVRSPGDSLRLLDRYYIRPGSTPGWNRQRLPADLAAGTITSAPGRLGRNTVPGRYTLGMIAGTPELLFTPQYNAFQPSAAPHGIQLGLPADATAIASVVTGDGISMLFVAGGDGLYLYPAGGQSDGSTPVRVAGSPLLTGAATLVAAGDSTRTSVWFLGPQGVLAYLSCPAGRESDPAAWTTPTPLLPAVSAFACYLDGAGNHRLFAHVGGQRLVCLSQDPVTSEWWERNIALPAADPNAVIVESSYTTQVTVTEDDGRVAPNRTVTVTASSPVGVYLDDGYRLLSPTTPITVSTDETGTLTIVQEVRSLAAANLRVAIADAPAVVAEINPTDRIRTGLDTVRDGSDLRAVMITDADGTTRPLVSPEVATANSDAVAACLTQFVGLLPDPVSPAARSLSATAHPAARQIQAAAAGLAGGPVGRLGPPTTWGMSFDGGHFALHGADHAIHALGGHAARATPLARPDVGSSLVTAAGDLFAWLGNAYDQVESFVVTEAGGVHRFLATIAGQVYSALLDSVDAVLHAVEFVFARIGIQFEDLTLWLGTVFVWPDIVRTHRVVKNIVRRYLTVCVDTLDDAGVPLHTALADVRRFVAGWAGSGSALPPNLAGATMGAALASVAPATGPGGLGGLGGPQASWGLRQLRAGLAGGGSTGLSDPPIGGDVPAMIQPLVDALMMEQDILRHTGDRFRTQVIDRIDTIPLDQLIESAVAVITDALLASVDTVLAAALKVLASLLRGVQVDLDARLDIPVLSGVYRQVTGERLSRLDAVCLAAAIPIIVGSGAAAGTAPFPADATTTALIDAPDFATIRQICASNGAATAVTALALTGGIAATVGAAMLSVSTPLAAKNPTSTLPPLIDALARPLALLPEIVGQLTAAPDDAWWSTAHRTILNLTLVKSLADLRIAKAPDIMKARSIWASVSPWLEFALGVLGQVPTTAAILDPPQPTPADHLRFWDRTCVHSSAMLAPALTFDDEPVTFAVVVGLASVLTMAHGVLACAAATR
ncbi:hypothetical protein [Frankia sp. QA3]|uniref:hypothetical protein n=1 Tax=Frankia sp. QA3 TaxID=710111 RepID=UPI000269C2B2|nr:hypothetical protein [Frankia sp. QA3]EIV91032.1 hypothetical protein FraQA3DRAFT_0451 [Frankia sp. QA3]